MKNILLIDADIIIYRFAFSHKETTDWNTIKADVRSFVEELLSRFDTDLYMGFITGPGNFRKKLKASKEYKGQRKADKPFWFTNIKNFLINDLGCYECRGIEADDALAIFNNHCNKVGGVSPIICTIDKDLLQVPGRHYNWNKEETKVVTEIEGAYVLANQWLTGDSGDNIAGCYKVGPKKAEKILSDKDGGLPQDRVLNAYIGNKHYISIAHAISEFNVNFQQLYMLRTLEEAIPHMTEKDFTEFKELKPIKYITEEIDINEDIEW